MRLSSYSSRLGLGLLLALDRTGPGGAGAMYLPPETLPESSSQDSLSADTPAVPPEMPDMPDLEPFEEATGPSQLFYSEVPNAGDTQLLMAVNKAIYEAIYQGTEEQRLQRWEALWSQYDAGRGHDDTMPPAHLCPSPVNFPAREEATGVLEEKILQQKELIYLASFSMPPFSFLSTSSPAGQIRVSDIRYSPAGGLDAHGILPDIFTKRVAPFLASHYGVPDLRVNWSFRPHSCDFRAVADSLYADSASVYVGLSSPSPHVARYFETSCPLMMYGKLSLITGFLKAPTRGGIASLNRPGVRIGTVAYVPHRELVRQHLPKATLVVYDTLPYLLGTVYGRDLHAFLLPSSAARAMLASGELCPDTCKIVGDIGENNRPLVMLFRKFPMDPPYVATFFDGNYTLPGKNCEPFF
ncbi:hypothetical protein CSUI_003769 [Cystoisospora suis]|uniref:Uncharacterized protein n=1 Tax=Cystoisospora suis TaxID=483139 RepID=A0A2C6KED9_9APIC|nr:hypothetical protein CSUI_003769 [Cystoisospora suis]